MTSAGLMWKNVWRRKLRAILTIVSILIAFLIFGVLRSFDQALHAGVDLAAADRLVVVSKVNFTVSLPYAYVNKIAAVDGVKRVTFATWFGAYWQEPRNQFAAFAVDPESWLETYPEMIVDPDDRARFLANRTGALVGANLAKRFGWKKGDRIPLPSTIWSRKDGSKVWELTVEGIFTGADAQTDTSYLVFHHDYLNEARSFARDTVGWIVVTTSSHERNDEVARAIDTMFYNSARQTKTDTEKAFSAAFIKQFGNIGLIITSVVGAAFFTILVITGTTMALAIRERTGEIAVLKTIGFTGRRVFALVLGESLFLALLGGIPGLLFASGLVTAMRAALAGLLPTMVFSERTLLEGLVLILALAFVTGIVPAANALRLNITAGLARG